MPSYIELDKQASFSASSNVGKLILAVTTNKDVSLTDSDGVTTIVTGGGIPYLEHTSKISNTESGFVKTKSVLSNTLNINPVWVKTNTDYYNFKFENHINVDKAISNVPRIDDDANYSEILDNLVVTNNFGNGFDGSVYSIVIQQDGKILVGGKFTTYNGIFNHKIIRLFSDGTVDTTFNIGAGFNGDVYSIAIQSDGKIVVGGAFTFYNGNSCNHIIRLNTDGSIDGSFNIGSGFDGYVNSIAIQSDGAIVCGGEFTDYNGNNYNRIIKLTKDGSIDGIFSIGTGFDNYVSSIVIQQDGKILVGGRFSFYNTNFYNSIIRLTTDGSIDVSFNIGSGFNDIVKSIAIQSDNKILVGGKFSDYNGTTSYGIIRLNTDGSIATTSSVGFNGTVNSIVIQSDGKIVCGGEFNNYSGVSSNYITRINSDFSIDTSFVMIGIGFNDFIRSIAIKSDGKLIVGGDFISYNSVGSSCIELLNTDGYFGFKSGFNKATTSVVKQSDGKILVGGGFGYYNNSNYNGIIRLTSDGSIDTTFSIGTGVDGTVYSIAVQQDGKILVGGELANYDGNTSNAIVRLNADGSFDNTFSTGTGFDKPVYSIVVQSDGKILVGGNFNSYNGNSYNRIIRLNTDGSIDGSFNIGTGFNNDVYSIVVQSDNKILVGGDFTEYNGNNYRGIIRLDIDGGIDGTFTIGTGFDSTIVRSIKIQSDNKILVGGKFSFYNNYYFTNIIRLNTDGNIDTTFNIGTGFDDTVYSIDVQSDGKILVGGAFTNYNGNSYNRFIRLNTDGSVNYDIIYTYDFDGPIYSVSAQSDWSIIVGGSFGGAVYYGDNIRKIKNEINFNLFKSNDILNNQPIEIRVYN